MKPPKAPTKGLGYVRMVVLHSTKKAKEPRLSPAGERILEGLTRTSALLEQRLKTRQSVAPQTSKIP